MRNMLPLLCLLCLTCSQRVFAAPRVDGPGPDAEQEDVESYTPEERSEDAEGESSTTLKAPIVIPPEGQGQAQQAGPHAKPFQSTKRAYRGSVKILPNILPDKSDYDIKDATVLCYDNEFTLNLQLSSPFTGYIYPYHHFKSCHLLTGDGTQTVSLLINSDSCGMDVSHGSESSDLGFVQYTVMLQWDKEVIGKWDRKIQVTCNRDDTDHRIVQFLPDDPLSNPKLDLEINTQMEDESDDGESDVYDVARVGETADVTVTVLSSTATYDAQILNCDAYDGHQGTLRTIGTYNINTTGETTYGGLKELYKDGCPTDKKWLAPFEKQRSGYKVVLASTLKVFRFPSSGIVVLSCRVQVCKEECAEIDCASKLEDKKSVDAESVKEVTLFRPIMVRLGAGMTNDHGHHDDVHTAQGLPTASFVAGLIGMGFVCAIVCVFMYRRFKKGSEKDYKMQYNVEKSKDEVAPLKVTNSASPE